MPANLQFMFAYEACQLESCCARRDSDPCLLGSFTDNNYSQRAFGDGPDRWSNVAHLYMMQHAMRGLLDTVGRFVPDLAPLVAGIVSSPLTLPLDE